MNHISIATEDELSEEICIRLIEWILPNYNILHKLRKGGNGYLKSSCRKFNEMAKRYPVFLLTDLDQTLCPKILRDSWIEDHEICDGLKFRVAVNEVESWIIADHVALALLLDCSADGIEKAPDALLDPKRYLLNKAKRAPREIRGDLIRMKGSEVKQGLGYNARLCDFVRQYWSPERAAARSASLHRAILRLQEMA